MWGPEEPKPILKIAGDEEEDEDLSDVNVTPPMPVLFLSHGAGPSVLTASPLAPQLEGMNKVLSLLLR